MLDCPAKPLKGGCTVSIHPKSTLSEVDPSEVRETIYLCDNKHLLLPLGIGQCPANAEKKTHVELGDLTLFV